MENTCSTPWSPKSMGQFLQSAPAKVIQAALIRIYDRQTRDEKSTNVTKHTNKIGFTACDASRGSFYARWVLSGRALEGHHLYRARCMAFKYRRQLADLANEKQARRASS